MNRSPVPSVHPDMTTSPVTSTADLVAAGLDRARRATEALVAPLSDEDLVRQVSDILSPPVWDLAHIGYFEELWLVRRLGGEPPTDPLFDDLYDAFRHARSERAGLPLLRPAATRRYMADVRRRTLEILREADLDGDDPLLRDGFVYGMIVQHELQHQETLLQALQMGGHPYPVPERPDGGAGPAPEEVRVPGGLVEIGTDTAPFAYDNERPAHVVEIAPFTIGRHPVTNGRYREFIADGGYRHRSLWSPAGWEWRCAEDAVAPLYWERRGAGWWRRRFGRWEPVPDAEPVQHVSFHEAEAFARWAGRRLPTEAEWEAAARGASPEGANLGRAAMGPLPVTGRAAGDAGCACMLGDVWEWTSSVFTGYPGFRAFPYAEYSEVFFDGGMPVLRGGSWATDPAVARPTFRNWDLPGRRQIFSGLRLAGDD